MKATIDETKRRRKIQMAYNEQHGITPQTISKSKEEIMQQTVVGGNKSYLQSDDIANNLAADPVVQYMSQEQLGKAIEQAKKKMQSASKDMDFLTAAEHRDEMLALKALYDEKFGQN